MTSTTAPTRQLTPLQALAKHLRLAAILPLLGALLGFSVAYVTPPTYTAQARVAVGMGDLSAGAIAGFPLAASQLAENYARYITDQGIITQAGATKVEGVDIIGSQVPNSSIILIEATSKSSEQAVKAVDDTSTSLIKQVNQPGRDLDPSTTLASYQKLSTQVAAADAAVEEANTRLQSLVGAKNTAAIPAARSTLATLKAKQSNLQVQLNAIGQKYQNQVSNSSTASNLVLVNKAAITKSDKSSRQQRYALLGLGLGLLLALLWATVAERRTARRVATSTSTSTVQPEGSRATAQPASMPDATQTLSSGQPAPAPTSSPTGPTKAAKIPPSKR